MKSMFAVLIFVAAFSPLSHAIAWKGIFLAGDNSITNFDNGRIDLTAAFSQLGDLSTIQVSSSADHYGKGGVLAADINGFYGAFDQLAAMAGEGCLIHMTSHGQKNGGFYLALAGILPPETLAALVDKACGQKPTVILISACYSGQFITEALSGPNRVILTAARADRPSFGCSPDTRYTYWDGCLLNEIPRSTTWVELYKNVQTCIIEKEAAAGVTPSEPQAFFGANSANWRLVE